MSLRPSIRRNDRLANWLIILFSVIMFGVVVALGRIPPVEHKLPFSPHVFATVNACINSTVAILLVVGVNAARRRRYRLHRGLLMAALVLSVLFLISYVAHHLLVEDTVFGGTGMVKAIYLFILITHIILAAVMLPFILYTAYRGLSGDYYRHRKLARWTFPIWLYVSISGVVVYLMISPYYNY